MRDRAAGSGCRFICFLHGTLQHEQRPPDRADRRLSGRRRYASGWRSGRSPSAVVAGVGVEPCDNVRAAAFADSLPVIAVDMVQAANDKPQPVAMLDRIAVLPEAPGEVEVLLADSGYVSEGTLNACAAARIAPVIAPGHKPHHPSRAERFAAAPPAP